MKHPAQILSFLVIFLCKIFVRSDNILLVLFYQYDHIIQLSTHWEMLIQLQKIHDILVKTLKQWLMSKKKV